jgi:Helicase associated domain.
MDISLTIETIRNITLSLNKDQVMRLPSDERYRYRIKQLLEYNNTFGTLDVPYNYKDDIQFAKWVQSQRYEYRLLRCKKVGVKSYLTPERVKLLDSIGFPWNDFRGTEQEGLSNRWMSNWNVLNEYKQEYGHVRVPENCVYRDVKLGIWVKNQRRYAKIYAKECRTQQRIEKLKELGFIWDTSQVGDTVYNATWMNRYEQVKDFYETHGHFCVPKTQRELALWMRTQRTMKQQLEDDPSSKGDVYGTSRQYLKERIQLLNDINFDWDGMKAIERQRNQIWWQRYHELCRFHKYYGHTNTAAVVKLTQNATSTIPNFCVAHHDIDLNRLHRWTKTQRVRYKEFRRLLLTSDDAHERIKSINQDKIDALARLGFVWDQREELWQSKFQKLKRFGEIHKHFNVPTSMSSPAFDELLATVMDLKNVTTDKDREAYMKEMVHLGKWAYAQRFKFRKYKRGERLSFRTEQHMQLLEEISFCNNDTMVDHISNHHSSIVTPPQRCESTSKEFLMG